MVVAVAHQEYLNRPLKELIAKVGERGCFIDVKAKFDKNELQAAGLCVWRL